MIYSRQSLFHDYIHSGSNLNHAWLFIILTALCTALGMCLPSCEGNVIDLAPTDGNINGPLSMVGFESGDLIYLVVGNTNYDLSQQTGSLSIIQFNTLTAEYSILQNESINIDSFSG